MDEFSLRSCSGGALKVATDEPLAWVQQEQLHVRELPELGGGVRARVVVGVDLRDPKNYTHPRQSGFCICWQSCSVFWFSMASLPGDVSKLPGPTNRRLSRAVRLGAGGRRQTSTVRRARSDGGHDKAPRQPKEPHQKKLFFHLESLYYLSRLYKIEGHSWLK